MRASAAAERLPHHTELGLQLDLQALQCASQVVDLCLGRLDDLCADGHLLGQHSGLGEGTGQRLGPWYILPEWERHILKIST